MPLIHIYDLDVVNSFNLPQSFPFFLYFDFYEFVFYIIIVDVNSYVKV